MRIDSKLFLCFNRLKSSYKISKIMDDELTCTECGNEFSSKLSFCPNCKCNVESKDPKKSRGSTKIFDHPTWGIIYLVMGGWLLTMGSEWYFQLVGIGFVGFGIHKLYKNFKRKTKTVH